MTVNIETLSGSRWLYKDSKWYLYCQRRKCTPLLVEIVHQSGTKEWESVPPTTYHNTLFIVNLCWDIVLFTLTRLLINLLSFIFVLFNFFFFFSPFYCFCGKMFIEIIRKRHASNAIITFINHSVHAVACRLLRTNNVPARFFCSAAFVSLSSLFFRIVELMSLRFASNRFQYHEGFSMVAKKKLIVCIEPITTWKKKEIL